MKKPLLCALLVLALAPSVSAQLITVPEDSPLLNGQRGVPILAKRCDSPAASTSTDGDATFICSDSAGRLIASFAGSKTNDNAAPTTDNVPVLAAIASSAAQSYTTGRQVLPRVNLFGHFGIFLTDPTTGANVTAATDVTEDGAEASGVTGPAVMSVRRNAAASSAGSDAEYATFNTDGNGLLWSRQLDPCSGVAKTTDPFSITTDTVIIAATSAKKNYICELVAVVGAAEIVSITEGTGSVCGTSEAALAGSTTDANGMSFAANGGVAALGGNASVIAGKTANVDTCLNVSGSNRVAGWVTWAQQ